VSHWIGNDNKLPQGRLLFASYVVMCMIVLLLLGFWKLQVLDSKYYAQLAERNRIRAIPLMAPRGRMLDRDGRVIVDNYPSFSVLLLRDDASLLEQSLDQISDGLDIPREELDEILAAAKGTPKFEPIKLKPEATPADIAFIEAHRADLPLLELVMEHRRRYPRDGFLAHVIGYVGEVSQQQVERSGGRYRSGDVVGKAGLERQYNEILMGTNGFRRALVNSLGKEVGRLQEKSPVSGTSIQLTIDLDLQQAAEAGLLGQKGAVVALDPRSGEILAMASHPAPDPNLFAVRIPREEWQRLNEDPDHPLLNRAIQAQLAPGSVFKVMMTAALLESKVIPEEMTVYCPGYADFYGRTFRCHVYNKGGHGLVNLHKAIVESCDIFFYNVGKRLGIDRIAYYARQLGLGQKTGIDLPAEEDGLVPSSEWKKRVLKDKWYAGETISVAIGQGATTTTPLQLAYSVGGIVMGGRFQQPHLLKSSATPHEQAFPLAPHTTEVIRQAMFGVVNEGGTAAASRLEGIEFCGKTGTSQLVSLDTLRRGVVPKRRLTENAWFVGYAPRDNPEIVVAVLVEHGAHGSTAAAPIARDIVKAYYDKKAARDKRQYVVEFRRLNFDGQPAPGEAKPAPTVAALPPEERTARPPR
jgi:penicillin-binding protein 2